MVQLFEIVKPPSRCELTREMLVRQTRADHLDWDAVLFQNRVIKIFGRHFPRLYNLVMQLAELESAEHVGALVKRPVTAAHRPSNFGGGIVPFVTDAIDKEVDALLRRHLFEMEPERKNDPCAAVHPPE